MNETIEILRQRSESVPVPLDLPDDEDLLFIEEQLCISLPRDLREFLLEASDVIYGSMEPVTAADPNSHTYLPEVAATAWESGLPRIVIPICEHQSHYYCMDQDGVVRLWQKGDFNDKEWESIWEWVEEIWLRE